MGGKNNESREKQWVRRIVTGNQRRIHCLVKSLNLAKTSQSLEKMGEGEVSLTARFREREETAFILNDAATGKERQCGADVLQQRGRLDRYDSIDRRVRRWPRCVGFFSRARDDPAPGSPLLFFSLLLLFPSAVNPLGTRSNPIAMILPCHS